jgi:hypothetical protein
MNAMKTKRCELTPLTDIDLQGVLGTATDKAGALDARINRLIDGWNTRQAALHETFASLQPENEHPNPDPRAVHYDILLLELLLRRRH